MLLMHGSVVVADVTVLQGLIISVNYVYNKDHLPVGVYHPNVSVMTSRLQSWQKNRSVPYGRMQLDFVLKNMEGTLYEAQIKAYMASLTDHYYIKEDGSSLLYDDIDFYKHGFSNAFADLVLYQTDEFLKTYKIPDFTTDGMLKKAWMFLENTPVLIKAAGVKSANEVVASKLADVLKIPHVEYRPITVNGTVHCACKSFSDGSVELVTGLQEKYAGPYTGLFLHNRFVELGMEAEVSDMLLLDHILHNTDRHEGNFGYLRDPATLEIKGFVPIYDTGTCLNADFVPGTKDTGETKPFLATRKEQFSLIKNVRLPEKALLENIIRETYRDFKLPEEPLQRALEDVSNTYELTKQLLAEREEEYDLSYV